MISSFTFGKKEYIKMKSAVKIIKSCIDGDLLKTGKFIYSKKEKLNFIDAEEYCTNLGLQLPMPASVAENNEAGFQKEASFIFGYQF